MSSAQLGRISERFERLLRRKPSLIITLANEKIEMLSNVQLLQNSCLSGGIDKLARRLNMPARQFTVLSNLQTDTDQEKLSFFQGLASEVEAKSLYWQNLAGLPTRLRDPKQMRIAPIKFASERPWYRLSNAFASAGEPLIAQNDEMLAKTRLLIATTRLLRLAKLQQPLPKDVSRFGECAVDPYTGQLFAYRWDGFEFKIYSAGQNGIDDGGRTDESATNPDLCLEYN